MKIGPYYYMIHKFKVVPKTLNTSQMPALFGPCPYGYRWEFHKIEVRNKITGWFKGGWECEIVARLKPRFRGRKVDVGNTDKRHKNQLKSFRPGNKMGDGHLVADRSDPDLAA